MHGYYTAGAISVLVPDLFINLIGGKYPSGVFHEQFQNVVFTGCQGNRFSVHGNGLGIIIQVDAADDQMGSFFCHAAQRSVTAQMGFNPCQNLNGIEGLCDVVVSADV